MAQSAALLYTRFKRPKNPVCFLCQLSHACWNKKRPTRSSPLAHLNHQPAAVQPAHVAYKRVQGGVVPRLPGCRQLAGGRGAGTLCRGPRRPLGGATAAAAAVATEAGHVVLLLLLLHSLPGGSRGCGGGCRGHGLAVIALALVCTAERGRAQGPGAGLAVAGGFAGGHQRAEHAMLACARSSAPLRTASFLGQP